MDHRHNNPVLTVFVDLIKQLVERNRENKAFVKAGTDQGVTELETKVRELSPSTSLLVKRMALAYTIHKNNRLIEHVKRGDNMFE